jgi:serine phosphatase RsbU (regulator of sigma subunit)
MSAVEQSVQTLLERALEISTTEVIQVFHRALLPTVDTLSVGISCTTRYRPGEERLMLGGDFLDVVDAIDGELAFVIGDVSGHGPLPAAVALAMRVSWRALTLAGADLESCLNHMNAVFASLPPSPELFVTVCAGVIDLERMTGSLVSAGHPPPIILTDTAVPAQLKPSPPLGVVTAHRRHEVTDIVLGPEWALLAYTDGLVEGRRAPGSPDRYGIDSLCGWLSEKGSDFGAAELDQLIKDVESVNGGRIDDDIAVLLLSSHPGR